VKERREGRRKKKRKEGRNEGREVKSCHLQQLERT
jgi:hypothetical protein